MIFKLNNYVERLQLYGVKVENLSEKLRSTVGDSDIEYTNLRFTENETVCYQAVKCISRLKQFEEAISMKMVKTEEAKEKYDREEADLLALVCDVYCDFVTYPFGIPGQVWYLIVSILEPCCLSNMDQLMSCKKLKDAILVSQMKQNMSLWKKTRIENKIASNISEITQI